MNEKVQELVEETPSWNSYPVLITVQENHHCKEGCRRKILAGSRATKWWGEYAHYPTCPRNGRENKATVTSLAEALKEMEK